MNASSATAAHAPPLASLLDLDADFRRDIPPTELALARRATPVAVEALRTGPWDALAWARARPDLVTAVVLDGIVMRRLRVAGFGLPELLGPGDVLDPPDDGALPAGGDVTFRVLEPARLAVLHADVLPAVARWPSLWHELRRRTAAQQQRLAAHGAICQMPRVESRLAALLALLAEQWGYVTPRGVVLPLRLTHEALGAFVGAQRPTVTLAVTSLSKAGLIEREGEAWLLRAGLDEWSVAGGQDAGHQRPLLLARAVTTRAHERAVVGRRPVGATGPAATAAGSRR